MSFLKPVSSFGKKYAQGAALLLLCLLALPLPALAGESIEWYGPNDPRNTGQLRQDPRYPIYVSLFPDGASGNTVRVSGDVADYVYGGLEHNTDGTDATAMGNSVIVSGGKSSLDVYGGLAQSSSGTATATGNSVIVNGGTIGSDVYGGHARSDSGMATATGNTVNISGGTILWFVQGGYAESNSGTATATGNSVIVNGGSIDYNAYGGHARSYSGTATATDNVVSISGGILNEDVYGGYAWSNSGMATATGNVVSISGGNVGGDVYGGFAYSGSGPLSTGNSVIVSRGNIGRDVHGGHARSVSGTATATGNSVIVSGGNVGREVYGGFAQSDSGTATATGNSVIVNGGTIGRDVYGGYAISGSGPLTTATGNVVTLSGSPQFDANTGIYGGFTRHGLLLGDGFSDNTLNIWNYTGNSVLRVGNFEQYNFVLPGSMQNGATLFTATGIAFFGGDWQGAISPTYDSVSSITGVNIMGGGTPLQAGDSITLMSYGGTGLHLASNGNSRIQGQKGVSLLYDWQLRQDASSLSATVLSVDAHPQAKALSEGRAAGLAFVNQGADLAAGAGMAAARFSAAGAGGAGASMGADGSGASGLGLAAFSAFQGGTSRYKTGSHVDVDGFSLMTGLAWNRETAYGNLLLGAFFEAGWGNYDSHNSFSNFASIKGSGDTEYYGGGILGRFEIPVGGRNGAGRHEGERLNSHPSAFHEGADLIYTEASIRAGWAETDFSSDDLRDGIGQKASYDSGSAYYGAHLGLGYIWNFDGASSLDLYTRYFWTHQDSDSVTVVGDPVKFKSADSHRWRGGARFSHSLATEKGHVFTPYIGAAYEHEFDGEARATSYGYSLDAPDLKGGTGIGELGLTFKPSAKHGVSLDLGVQGYTGTREGVTGSLQFKWEF